MKSADRARIPLISDKREVEWQLESRGRLGGAVVGHQDVERQIQLADRYPSSYSSKTDRRAAVAPIISGRFSV